MAYDVGRGMTSGRKEDPQDFILGFCPFRSEGVLLGFGRTSTFLFHDHDHVTTFYDGDQENWVPEDMLQMSKLFQMWHCCCAQPSLSSQSPFLNMTHTGLAKVKWTLRDSHQGQLRSLQMSLEVELGRTMQVCSLFTLQQRSPGSYSSC